MNKMTMDSPPGRFLFSSSAESNPYILDYHSLSVFRGQKTQIFSPLSLSYLEGMSNNQVKNEKIPIFGKRGRPRKYPLYTEGIVQDSSKDDKSATSSRRNVQQNFGLCKEFGNINHIYEATQNKILKSKNRLLQETMNGHVLDHAHDHFQECKTNRVQESRHSHVKEFGYHYVQESRHRQFLEARNSHVQEFRYHQDQESTLNQNLPNGHGTESSDNVVSELHRSHDKKSRNPGKESPQHHSQDPEHNHVEESWHFHPFESGNRVPFDHYLENGMVGHLPPFREQHLNCRECFLDNRRITDRKRPYSKIMDQSLRKCAAMAMTRDDVEEYLRCYYGNRKCRSVNNGIDEMLPGRYNGIERHDHVPFYPEPVAWQRLNDIIRDDVPNHVESRDPNSKVSKNDSIPVIIECFSLSNQRLETPSKERDYQLDVQSSPSSKFDTIHLSDNSGINVVGQEKQSYSPVKSTIDEERQHDSDVYEEYHSKHYKRQRKSIDDQTETSTTSEAILPEKQDVSKEADTAGKKQEESGFESTDRLRYLVNQTNYTTKGDSDSGNPSPIENAPKLSQHTQEDQYKKDGETKGETKTNKNIEYDGSAFFYNQSQDESHSPTKLTQASLQEVEKTNYAQQKTYPYSPESLADSVDENRDSWQYINHNSFPGQYHNTGTSKGYICDHCGREFSHLSSLNNHIRTHTGQKPFSCSYCGKRFAQSGVLTAHLRTHTGDRPFECIICKKRFAQTTTLANHIRTHTGQKPFSCKFCKRKFAQSSTRNKHELSHTKEKPYVCKYCGRTFAQSATVTRHMRIHMRQESFVCVYCGKEFPYLHALDKHLDSHNRLDQGSQFDRKID